MLSRGCESHSMVLKTSTATSKRLLAALVAVWLCTAVSAGRCPAGCRCSPDGQSASCAPLLGHRLPQGLPPTLTSLDASQHRLRAVDGDTFAALPLLQAIDVSRGRITQVSVSAFHRLVQLRQLVLSENWLTSVPVDAFPDSLEELDLSRNPLSLPETGTFLRADGITTLNLSHCAITTVGDETFSQMPSLIKLDLRGNPLSELSPLAFLGLRQLFVDEGSLGDSAIAVMQLVQQVVQIPRVGATTAGDFTSQHQPSQNGADMQYPPSVYDDPETTAVIGMPPDGGADQQRDTQVYNQFSSLFGPVPQDTADSNLFKGAPFQATGEVTVVYASDLKNLKDTLLVLGALAVLCFLLAALQRVVGNMRSGARASSVRRRRHCLLNACFRTGEERARPGQQQPGDADCFWWDTETPWWEAGKPRGGDLPPPYPSPPTYEDSLTITVTPNPSYDGQPASVHQASRQQPDTGNTSRVPHSTDM